MDEKKVYKCKYCGMEFDDRHKMTGHMMHCEKNPNRVEAKRKKKSENPQDTPPKIEDKKQQEKAEVKEEKLEDIEKPKSSLQEIGEVLKAYGITSGEALMRTIDDKARQMPFYVELSSKVEAMEAELTELRNLIAITNKAVNGLVPKLDAIQRAMSGVSEQASNVQSLNSQAQQVPAELTQEQMQQMQMQQPQMQPQREGLSSWFDRLLALLQLGSSQENQSQPPPSPEELKYKEIVNLASVLKELQGDPHKQFERDMKLFIDLAKVFRNIPTNSGSVKVKPKSKTEELEE